jgi:hypothetical protein
MSRGNTYSKISRTGKQKERKSKLWLFIVLKEGNNSRNIITAVFKIRYITNFAWILFVLVLFIPAWSCFVYKCICHLLLRLIRIYKSNNFCRAHHVPNTIWTYHNKSVLLWIELYMLNFRVWDQSNFLGLQVTKCTCHGYAWALIVSPHTVRTNWLTIVD